MKTGWLFRGNGEQLVCIIIVLHVVAVFSIKTNLCCLGYAFALACFVYVSCLTCPGVGLGKTSGEQVRTSSEVWALLGLPDNSNCQVALN